MKQLIYKALLFIVFITLVFSCKEKSREYKEKSRESVENGALIKRSFYDNGNVKEEGTFVNDSIIDGWKKGYYEDGKLKYTAEYKNDKQNGWTLSYYEDGKLRSKTYYIDGLADGKADFYHPNGKLESETYWIKGKQRGTSKFYYEDGKQLRSYGSWDFYDHTKYIREYDPKGNIILDTGRVLVQLVIEGGFYSVQAGKKFNAEMVVAEPPGTKTRAFLGEINAKGEIINLKEGLTRKRESIVSFDEMVFKEPGKHKLIIIGKMEDLKTGNIKNDTIIEEMNVLDGGNK